MRIRDGNNLDQGFGMEKSRIRDKHPESATLITKTVRQQVPTTATSQQVNNYNSKVTGLVTRPPQFFLLIEHLCYSSLEMHNLRYSKEDQREGNGRYGRVQVAIYLASLARKGAEKLE
jgi:hypothetical protein